MLWMGFAFSPARAQLSPTLSAGSERKPSSRVTRANEGMYLLVELED